MKYICEPLWIGIKIFGRLWYVLTKYIFLIFKNLGYIIWHFNFDQCEWPKDITWEPESYTMKEIRFNNDLDFILWRNPKIKYMTHIDWDHV